MSKADDYALTGETVRKALQEDKEKGLIPFLLSGCERQRECAVPDWSACAPVSTIATTSTGAVDHLADIAQVGYDFPTLFIHVDAAVGAYVVVGIPLNADYPH